MLLVAEIGRTLARAVRGIDVTAGMLRQAVSRRRYVQQFKAICCVRRVQQILTIFLFLQLLDVMTTVVGLHLGAAEANVFISQCLHMGTWSTLLGSKIIAVVLAAAALMFNRQRLVRFVNFWFVGVVGWNLLIISRLTG